MIPSMIIDMSADVLIADCSMAPADTVLDTKLDIVVIFLYMYM